MQPLSAAGLSYRPALNFCTLHWGAIQRLGAVPKGNRGLQSRSAKAIVFELAELRAPFAIIESACGNSSQTGAYASATPTLVSPFLRGFALPPFALAPEASATEQAG